jgi:asparagine synthase (glutamine-hydrolysing)
MSALAGILNFHSAVDEHALASLGSALDLRGPDGGYDLAAGNIGMSYRAFHTNGESRLEVQPLVTREGRMLSWNGRLDNRSDLIRDLRHYFPDAVATTIPDVAIVMAAYLKWEKACFERLVGDFCLALWDPRQRVLYLVRDVVGTRPLKYHINETRIVWSTETSALLNFLGGSPDIEEEYLAAAMSLGRTAELTPFKNIIAVKPAHVFSVTSEGHVSSERFWKLDPSKKIRYRTDEEYKEHALSEFTEAVRCRLRSDRPVFAELSGGLDSSSIVCLSDKITGEESRVETVSHVFDECRTSDERTYISLVETQRGIAGHHIKDEDNRLLAPLPDDVRVVTPNPIALSFGFHSGLSAAMNSVGSRVLLSGIGGDQMFGGVYGAYPEVADHLSSMKLLALHKSLQAWSGALKRSYLDLLWRDAIVRMFPARLQAKASRRPTPLPPWYNREFVTRMKLHDRCAARPAPRSFRMPSARDQVAGFLSAVDIVSACWRNEQFGIDVTYPYLHRPLVEFLQAIPVEQLLRPGENRVLMRRMMAGILPAEIAARRTKGNPSEAIFRAIGRESKRLRSVFQHSRLCARGYIEKEPLLAAFDRAAHGYEKYGSFLVQTISLEFWLRGVEDGASLTRKPAAVPKKWRGQQDLYDAPQGA